MKSQSQLVLTLKVKIAATLKLIALKIKCYVLQLIDLEAQLGEAMTEQLEVLIPHHLPIQERTLILKSSKLIGTEKQIDLAKKIIDKAIRKGWFGSATANVDIKIPLSAAWWIENQDDQDLRSELFCL